MGEYFMVILFCLMGECQTIYQEKGFETYQGCLEESAKTSQLFHMKFPNSQGEIYCLNQEQFNNYLNSTEEMMKEKISA